MTLWSGSAVAHHVTEKVAFLASAAPSAISSSSDGDALNGAGALILRDTEDAEAAYTAGGLEVTARPSQRPAPDLIADAGKQEIDDGAS